MNRLLSIVFLVFLLQGCRDSKSVRLQLQLCSSTPLGTAYASSAVNVSIFRQCGLLTGAEGTWIAFYDADGFPVLALASGGTSNRLARILPSPGPALLGDGHCVISLGRSDDGFLHVLYGAHGNQPWYVRIPLPIAPGSDFTATLWPDALTYPQFYSLGSRLMLVYRDDTTNLITPRIYDAGAWGPPGADWTLGPGAFTSVYPHRLAVSGTEVALTWVYRLAPQPDEIVRNQGLYSLRSTDSGQTWQDAVGGAHVLPAGQMAVPELLAIGPDSGLMNQSSSTIGPDGLLYITNLHQDSNGVEQVFLASVDFSSGNTVEEPVSRNPVPFDLVGGGTLLLPLSRPEVVVSERQIHVIYRDGDRMIIASRGRSPVEIRGWRLRAVEGLPALGGWEPIIDHGAWDRDRRLLVYVQSARQGPRDTAADGPPEPARLLEFREAFIR